MCYLILFHLTAPEDFQLSNNNMLTYVDGTNELQQCIDLMVVDDNLVEQTEFFSLMATASSGSTASEFFFISNNDSEYYVLLSLQKPF